MMVGISVEIVSSWVRSSEVASGDEDIVDGMRMED
jgi:hypothetical protein